MFIADLPFAHWTDGGSVVGELKVTDDLRIAGGGFVRRSVLATVADVVAGVAAMWPTDGGDDGNGRLALTADLTVRTLEVVEVDSLTMAARVLKRGRTTIVAETLFIDSASARALAVSHATFVRSPRPQDVTAPPGRPESGPHRAAARSIGGPFADQLGARVIGPGAVEIDLRPYVTQLSGTLQGGAVALLGELASESLGGRPVRDLEIRYLSAVRVGPARTSSRMLDASTVRVEVRDTGNDERLASLVVARLGA